MEIQNNRLFNSTNSIKILSLAFYSPPFPCSYIYRVFADLYSPFILPNTVSVILTGLLTFDDNMDSRGLNFSEENMTNSERRGLDLDIDLNYPQPSLDLSLGLSYANSQEVHAQAQVHRWPQHLVRNAIEILDDEVAIITPREYAEARENSERNRSRGIISQARGIPSDHPAETTLCNNCKNSISDDCQPCFKPGTSNKKKAKNASLVQELPQPIPVPEESIFNCPICMGPLIEPTSTKCGHIFCKECILRSIKSLRSKCPTCRQKVGKRSIFRIYLPNTN